MTQRVPERLMESRKKGRHPHAREPSQKSASSGSDEVRRPQSNVFAILLRRLGADPGP